MVPNAGRYVLAYFFWAVSVVIAVVVLLVSRTSLMLALGVTTWDRYFEHALNQFGFLFLAIFILAVIIFTEHFYRTGVEKNKLFARFLLITLLESIALIMLHLARLVAEISLGLFTSASLLVVGSEFVLTLVLVWLYRQATGQRTTTPIV